MEKHSAGIEADQSPSYVIMLPINVSYNISNVTTLSLPGKLRGCQCHVMILEKLEVQS